MSNLLNMRQKAVEISRRSYAKYHHHGAIVFRNGKIISSGVNDENHHAEENAVRNVYRLLWRSQKGKQR